MNEDRFETEARGNSSKATQPSNNEDDHNSKLGAQDILSSCHGIQNNGQNCLMSQIDAQTVNKGLSRFPSDKTSAFHRSVWKFRIGDKTWNNLL